MPRNPILGKKFNESASKLSTLKVSKKPPLAAKKVIKKVGFMAEEEKELEEEF